MPRTKTMAQAEREICTQLVEKGVPLESAQLVAKSLVYADARGTRSHGVNMLPAYLERLDAGGIDREAKPVVLRETGTSVVLDAQNGFGQVAVYHLLGLLLYKAEKGSSIVCGSVRGINHCGALAFYTEEAARNGYIACLFANANPTVAPFGGMEAALGTNPLSMAFPTEDSPIVLDMATSAVAKAKIYHAANKGEKIDPDWALDSQGNPTDNPNEAIRGVLTSMAGPKGYGLAVAVEVLAGVLSGGGITSQVSSVHKTVDRGMNAGAFCILIRPDAFLPPEEYSERITGLIRQIKNTKPQPGQGIFLPGELENRQLKHTEKEGIEY